MLLPTALLIYVPEIHIQRHPSLRPFIIQVCHLFWTAYGAFHSKTVPQLLTPLQHCIDEAVIPGLFRRHEVIAVGIVTDLIQVLSSMFDQDFIQLIPHPQDFPGVDVDRRST